MRDPVAVAIPPEIERLYNALPSRTSSPLKRRWADWEDALILRGWNREKRNNAIARFLGVDYKTALARYRELTA